MRETLPKLLQWLRRPAHSPAALVAFVIFLTAVPLAIDLPNFVMHARHIYGLNGVDLSGNRVIGLYKRGEAPNQFRVGDIVQLDRMPIEDRDELAQYSRLGPVTKVVRVPVLRNGRPITVQENFIYDPRLFGDAPLDVGIDVIEKTATLLLALLGAALLLLRPSAVSWTFFLYAAGLAVWDGPLFWSFVPPIPFAIIGGIYAIYSTLPPIMFPIFALRLTEILKPRTRMICERAFLVAGLAMLIIPAIDAVRLFTDPGSGEVYVVPPPTTTLKCITLFVAALIFVVAAMRRIRTGKGIPIAASLCFAGAGLSLILHLYGILLDPDSGILNVLLPVLEASLYFPLSLAGAYFIIRSRTLDVRLTVTRAVTFAALGYGIIAVIVGANWVFARRLADISFLIPLELMFAVWLGYRLSGLRELSQAFSLATSEATAARLRGDPASEQQLLAKALAAAELMHKPSLVSEVRARMAFSAWLDGDEKRCNEHLAALENAIGSVPSRGLGFFLAGARNQLHDREPARSDLAEWVSRACLMASAGSADAGDALLRARQATRAAEQADQPLLALLALIAKCELTPSTATQQRDRAFELARELGSEPFEYVVRAYFEASHELGVLEPFVRKFKSPAEMPSPLEIAFLRVEVRVSHVPVALREAERALLFAIAYRPIPVSSDALADELWPDRDGDAAKNALRVCMHRLRRALGTEQCILRGNDGYMLRPDAAVDLHEMPHLASSVPLPLTPSQRSRFLAAFEQLLATEGLRAAAGDWFSRYAHDIAARYNAYALTLGRDALRRGAPEEALAFLKPVLERDPDDVEARELRDATFDAIRQLAASRRVIATSREASS
jgi:tetratricopeptide (TPR) repeat protein